MIFSDHLSRNIRLGDGKPEELTCKGLDLKIEDVYLNASEDKCVSLAKETEKYEILVALKAQIIRGWPEHRDECQRNLLDYWSYRDELSILDSLVLKETRITVPKQCREELLGKLHEGHFGVDRTKLRARDSVYWPSINKEIETLIRTCETCQENSKRNAKDPMLAREIPLNPWTLIETDLFSLNDHTFLLVVDVTSRFPVVRILNRKTSRLVINALKGIYCDFGLPK